MTESARERRNHSRVSLKASEQLSGIIYRTGKVSASKPCIISEVSMAGMKLSIDNDQAFANGHTLTLKGLQTTSGITVGENILLEVGWSYQHHGSGKTVYGCRFITISRKTQESIAVLMEQQAANCHQKRSC